MKQLICLAIALLTSIGNISQAQTAKQVLDKCAKVVSNKSGATASFSMSMPKTAAMKGTISIKGKKFTASSNDGKMWFDGKTLWTYVKKNQEVNVSTPTATQLSRLNPYNFINLYKAGYTSTMKKSGNLYDVKLKKAGAEIPEMNIKISSGNYHPVQVKLTDKKGRTTTIDISNFKTANLKDNIFKFDSKAYPKAEIIDLR